jgi:hypothetical protein
MPAPRRSTREDSKSAAAYTLVDLSDLEPDIRKDIIEDAYAGGAQFGVRVVEEAVNGGARSPLFGYYNAPNPDAQRWEEAKEELGISVDENVDEVELRHSASLTAAEDAERARKSEEAAVAAITGEEDDDDDDKDDTKVAAKPKTKTPK